LIIQTPSPDHSPLQPQKRISVTEPISDALKWTKWVLFEDFEIGKWFVLGFCAFLANLGEGGSSSFSFNPGGGLDSETAELLPFQKIIDFILAEPVLFGIICISIFALIIGFIILFTWLNSRGKFMFLDGVVHNRARVTEPWHRFRASGENLFVVRILLFIAGSVSTLIVLLIGFAIAWNNIQAEVFGAAATISIIFCGISLFALFIAFMLTNALLTDFIVQIMYRRNLPVIPAVVLFRDRILKNHIGSFVLFYLMKLVITIGTGMVILIGGCLTCCFLYCVSALPYIGSVLLLPVSVFMRSYDIFFFKQFGEEWDLFRSGERAES